MRKSFRDTYNRELSLLYERASEFAAEYPGIADRLGGLLRDNTDPAVAGLLEGTAFLAARVQLKMQEEFRGFTEELLEQIFPDALAPLPSMMLVQAHPPFDNKDLDDGLTVASGAYIDARFVDADQRVSCRYRLGSAVTLWPLLLSDITYHDGPAGLSALGLEPAAGTVAGVQINLDRPQSSSQGPIADLPLSDLTFHLTGAFAQAVRLYEQVHCNLTRATLRYLDAQGDPVFIRLPPDCLHQIGFHADERLLPHSSKLFDGFAQLREAFAFSRKYLGFRLTGLQAAVPLVRANTCQLLLEFDSSDAMLSAGLRKGDISLHCATAVNLFEETASQVRLDTKRHEYVVTPDSSPVTHYEIHALQSVYAHYPGSRRKVPVHPLYGLPDDQIAPAQALYFTTKRKRRRLTAHEKRFGRKHRYRGTETFISLYEPPKSQGDTGEAAQRLQIRALCSNRHLPEYLPIAGAVDDFHVVDDISITLGCVAGPTPPREPLSEIELRGPHRAMQGDVYWRLISYLSLSHFGLDDRGKEGSAAALREILSLFADISDTTTQAQITGITGLQTRQITRSVQRADGFFPARGIEIRLTFDEDAYEGTGIVLMGAILDRFLAEYANINSFTQTVIVSQQRGVLKRWAPRTGSGPLI